MTLPEDSEPRLQEVLPTLSPGLREGASHSPLEHILQAAQRLAHFCSMKIDRIAPTASPHRFLMNLPALMLHPSL